MHLTSWNTPWTLLDQREEGGTLGSDETLHLVGVFINVWCWTSTLKMVPINFWQNSDPFKKNAAKRSRQHAGKKYREYAQRRVCFINKQVPCSTPSNIDVKFWRERAAFQRSAFGRSTAVALVVFAWKCRLFCLFAHGQCRVYYIYHVEFHFRFEHLITFPV